MPRGPRLPKDNPIRKVDSLFPERPPLTPEQEKFYRDIRSDHGPYVFAVDRQSDKGVLNRAEHTGQVRRVELIKGIARQAGWLKEPIYIESRHDGELAYSFDRNFWFIDGEKKNATGYSVNVNARPEFLRAYHLACSLGEIGCGPAAFVLGEGTRLFRDDLWASTFCKALWYAQVRIFVGNFGEVTHATLPGFIAMIHALSSWLPQARKGARLARKAAKQVFQKDRIHLGLITNDDGSEIYADPAVWPLLSLACEKMADRSLPTVPRASEWLAERGLKRSPAWLRQLIQCRPILDGYYDAHRLEDEPRMIVNGPLRDLDITSTGYRRYLRRLASDPLLIPINFNHFKQKPIPPEVLLQVRRSISGSGRRIEGERLPGFFLSGRYTRCAICGCAIVETVRRRPSERFEVRCKPPRLHVTSRDPGTRVQEVERLREWQHCRYSLIDEPLSAKVWRVLLEGVIATPFDPTALDEPDEAAEERRLKEKLRQLDAELGTLLANLTVIRFEGAALAQVQSRQASLSSEMAAVQVELDTLATTMIQRRQQSMAFRKFQRILREYGSRLSDQEKGELVELIVERIEVDIEARSFQVHVNVSAPTLQGLVGRWGETEVKNTPCGCATFKTPLIFSLAGRFAA